MKNKTNKNRINIFAITTILLAATLVMPGCVDPYAPKIVSPLTTQTEIIGQSVQNHPIECFRFGSGPEVILVLASIHGNESAGTPLVWKLIEHLQKDRRLLANRTIMIIPVANPDGAATGTRENVNEVDLNRNFPAANRINITEYGTHPLSEPESLALKEVVEANRPAIVVSIHMPLSCIDYDGPAQLIAENMGRVCDLPVTKLGARPGSMGAYIGETLGIPIITLELRPTDSSLTADELWAKYGRALVAAIVYPEILY
jgi:murein peptide amidase A